VNLLENDRAASITMEQIEVLCELAEEKARKFIFSKIPPKKVDALSLSVEIEGIKPLSVNMELELRLSPTVGEVDAETLAKKALNEASIAIESKLRDLKLNLEI